MYSNVIYIISQMSVNKQKLCDNEFDRLNNTQS